MDSWHSYSSIFNLGHRAVKDLFTVPVIVEEKIDGSQFSFGVDEAGEIHVRSKGAIMNADTPEKMFSAGVATVRGLRGRLTPGWTYRGEYLQKPKHNALAYDRIPMGHVILFDVATAEEAYLSYAAKALEAERLGLEVVPLLFEGIVTAQTQIAELLETISVLGGQRIEGVVVKPAAYNLFGLDKKCLMGKFVSEAFKEVHSASWKEANPQSGDILERLSAMYRIPTRWNKAIQHLRERGVLQDDPRDIGAPLKEIPADIEKECSDEIREALWKWAWPQIRRQATRGFPEWYKEQLLARQFEPPLAE
jgi:hypothetical protein